VTQGDNTRRPRKAPRKPAPAARTAPVQSAELSDQAGALYESIRQSLVMDADRGLLGRIAEADLLEAGGLDRQAAQARSDILFAAARLGADELLARDRQSAADVFTDYVTQVLPVLRTRGLTAPDVRRELRRMRLVSLMSPEVLVELDDAAQAPVEAKPLTKPPKARSTPPTPIQPAGDRGDVALVGDVTPVESDLAEGQRFEPPPSADEPQEHAEVPEIFAVQEPEEEEPEADDTTAAVKSIEEIIDHCLAAERHGRKVILVIGLATTGKSFLVRRLKHSLRRDYSVAESRALPRRGAHGVGRTMDVLLYSFTRHDRMSAAENFDLYDIPGDWFSKLLASGFQNTDENPFFSLIYTILTFADAIVFLAPAYHVLMPEAFVEKGDDDPDLMPQQRRERREQMDRFIDSLDPMTIAAALLRQEMRRRMPRRPLWGQARQKARAEAARAAVQAVGAMSVRQILDQRRTAGRLDIPGALLLSRTDEFARRLPKAQADMIDVFDRDPAQMMLALGLGREYFSHLSSRFSAFTADFLTAQENPTFTRTFRAARPSAGVTSFFRDWLLPAISACRRPVWLRPLESPGLALWVRRVLDPLFARAWNRE
jgi:hypothetical protein